MALYEEYISLVNKKSNELKLKNFYTLTNIFRKNKETIYLDSVHLKNGTKDLGMRMNNEISLSNNHIILVDK
jgi:hypothetical protein